MKSQQGSDVRVDLTHWSLQELCEVTTDGEDLFTFIREVQLKETKEGKGMKTIMIITDVTEEEVSLTHSD